MKTWIKIFSIGFIALTLSSCARKSNYICGLGSSALAPSIESKIITFKTVGIADTTKVFISGSTLSKDSIDNKIASGTLTSTAINFINLENHDTTQTTSNQNGKFEKYLKAGYYDIIIRYVGYTTLIIKNVQLNSGELKTLDILLGKQGGLFFESIVDNLNK
jgi:Carboxypeptidase regulatory-like domain